MDSRYRVLIMNMNKQQQHTTSELTNAPPVKYEFFTPFTTSLRSYHLSSCSTYSGNDDRSAVLSTQFQFEPIA